MSKMLDAVTYTLTNSEVDLVASYRDYAKEARATVAARAESFDSAVSFLLKFACDEQIRRFKKQITDEQERTSKSAKAAFYEKLVAAKTDAERAKLIADELATIKK